METEAWKPTPRRASRPCTRWLYELGLVVEHLGSNYSLSMSTYSAPARGTMKANSPFVWSNWSSHHLCPPVLQFTKLNTEGQYKVLLSLCLDEGQDKMLRDKMDEHLNHLWSEKVTQELLHFQSLSPAEEQLEFQQVLQTIDRPSTQAVQIGAVWWCQQFDTLATRGRRDQNLEHSNASYNAVSMILLHILTAFIR